MFSKQNLMAVFVTLVLMFPVTIVYPEEKGSLQSRFEERIAEVLKQQKEIAEKWKNKPVISVRKSHPRLFPEKEHVPKLKERLNQLKYDEWEKSGRIKYLKGGFPLFYYITGENKYKEMMLSSLTKLLATDPTKGTFLTNPSTVSSLAEIYDIFYGELKEDQRKKIKEKIIEISDACMLGKGKGGGYMFCGDYGLGYHNGFYFQLAALARAGYAIYGDDPKGEEYIKKSYERFLTEVIPAILYPGKGGGWWEGTDYQHFAIPSLVNYINIVQEATGVDLMEIKELREFLHLNIYFTIYSCYPWRTNFEWEGDNAVVQRMYCSGDVFGGLRFPAQHKRRFLLYLLKRTHDPYLQWFLRHSGNQLNRSYTSDIGLEILYDTTKIPEKTLDGLPLVNFIEGMGLLFVRSDWSEEATWAVMQTVPKHSYHSWPVNNKVAINRCGELMADMYGDACITGISYNDQPESFWKVLKNPESYNRAGISALDVSKYHVYCCGDASKNYTKGKEAIRQFVYLRPHTFLIFDRIESNEPDPTVYYIANFNHIPKIQAQIAIVDAAVVKERNMKMVEPGLYPQEKVDPNIDWKESITDPVPTVPYKGRLFHKTLWPKNANIEIKERNYLGEWDQYDLICRNDVSITKPRWLTVCYAGTQDMKEMPQAELLEVAGKLGAKVTADGKIYEVWFLKDGERGGSVKITDKAGGKILLESDFPGTIQNIPDILGTIGGSNLYPVR